MNESELREKVRQIVKRFATGDREPAADDERAGRYSYVRGLIDLAG